MNNDNSLTLAFSCLGERLPTLLENLAGLIGLVSENIHFLVVVQKWNAEQKCMVEPKSVQLCFLPSIGLSKSRNAVIDNAKTSHVWFLDDDVQLTVENIVEAEKLLDSDKANFYRVNIGCIEWHDKTFKQYKKVKNVSRLNLLQVSSIEIIADLEFIKINNIRFNEKIGLGTDYQGAEEIHFLLDAWDKGASFSFIDDVLVRHTCIFEQRVLSNKNIFTIRGATASRFGFTGYLLLIRWAMRYIIKERNISNVLAMFKGFFRGYTSFK
ncbi:MAG: glycosyltransferase [Colwellia sp.]|nr:glycosyltransferase [Colwellia sp.]